MLWVTEAYFTAKHLNALINEKTASKGLQFGVTKCKYMVVGKDAENLLVSDLTVDKWDVSHHDDPETWENILLKSRVKAQTTNKQTEVVSLTRIIDGWSLQNDQRIRKWILDTGKWSGRRIGGIAHTQKKTQ